MWGAMCLLFISEVFCNKNKTILRKGDTLRFPKLAETLETIAAQGVDAFYKGKIGHNLIQDVKAAGWYHINMATMGLCISANTNK